MFLPHWGLLGWGPLGESLGAAPGAGGAEKERQAPERPGVPLIGSGQERPLGAAAGLAEAGLGMVQPHPLGRGAPGSGLPGIGCGPRRSLLPERAQTRPSPAASAAPSTKAANTSATTGAGSRAAGAGAGGSGRTARPGTPLNGPVRNSNTETGLGPQMPFPLPSPGPRDPCRGELRAHWGVAAAP